jgi:hypothetical protein
MAKAAYCATGIKHNGVTYAVGDKLDPSLFTADELKQLYDMGSVYLQDVPDEKKDDTPKPDTSVAKPDTAKAATTSTATDTDKSKVKDA